MFCAVRVFDEIHGLNLFDIVQLQDYLQSHTGLAPVPVKNTIKLLQDGATVPFIARYRKEQTQGLDEVAIANIRDGMKKYEELISRQQTILASITEQGKLTAELQEKITHCFDATLLEDLYLPFKQKRQTKGDKAKKLGLEPLAKMIMGQHGGKPEVLAQRFVRGEVLDEDMAIEGAKDIIAEWINEHLHARSRVRQLFQRQAIFQSKVNKGKEIEGAKYRDYFDFSEPVYKCASHRVLALIRAEREGIITLKAQPEAEQAIMMLERIFVKGEDGCSKVVAAACKESYKRLMCNSLENELMGEAKEKADKEAIKNFSTNLRQLLLAAPLGAKRVLAIDPGFRTGCKVVCLDASGNLLTNLNIYPHPPQSDVASAKIKIQELVTKYQIEAIAIGDGTAGRETETIVRQLSFGKEIPLYMVREDGASIYSASAIARKEFPNDDITVRGSVSIGRRLMDPLAELVKIDPKSLGVGQYQHDVNQQQLKDALDDVVISCVNAVGVDLNTASPSLLSYVSGLGPTLAENIVSYRTENGGIRSREELKKVKRLGDKAFEQAAGFLRIRDAVNPLDNSAVHPESYKVIQAMAKRLKTTIPELLGNETLLKQLHKEDFPEIDLYTFTDIVKELQKPGRDPRKQATTFAFDARIRAIDDVYVGMLLPGIVTNVTAFGAFVNLGIKENGMIHKSNLADTYVDDPSKFVALNQQVTVQVLEVDKERKRIALKLLQN